MLNPRLARDSRLKPVPTAMRQSRFSFGTEDDALNPKSQLPNPQSPILWGATAAATIGIYAATAKKRRKERKEAKARSYAAAQKKADRLNEAERQRKIRNYLQGQAILKAQEEAARIEAQRELHEEQLEFKEKFLNPAVVDEPSLAQMQAKLAREKNEMQGIFPPFIPSLTSADNDNLYPFSPLDPINAFNRRNIIPICLPGFSNLEPTTFISQGYGGNLRIGEPSNTGNLIGKYHGEGENSNYALYGIVGDDVTQVSVKDYGASYDVSVYKNLVRMTINEKYFFSGTNVPQMDIDAQAFTNLEVITKNGTNRDIPLGPLRPGNLAYSYIFNNQKTTIDFWGKENFPESFRIRVSIVAEGVGATDNYYDFTNPSTP